MNRILRALVVLVSVTFASALYAGSKTYDIGAQAGTVNVTIEMYYGGDYSFALVNNDTGEVVANIDTVTSFDYSHWNPDWIWSNYAFGTYGTASLAGSWGAWMIENVPAGNYSIVARDCTYADWVYDLSSVWSS